MDKPVSQSGIKTKTRDQWHARGVTWVYQFPFDWLPTYCKKNIFPFKLNRTDSKHRQSSKDLMLGSFAPFSFRCDTIKIRSISETVVCLYELSLITLILSVDVDRRDLGILA